MADDVGERRLVQAWQRGLGDSLRLTDGRSLHVVFRGRCPGGAGPDVRGALLAFEDGSLLEGDVEFHQRASDWFSHGHQNDAHYRGVILHVVLAADVAPPNDHRGQPIPTLVVVLPDQSDDADPPAGPEPCHRQARVRGADALGALLDDLGDRRLAQRAARFEAELTRLTPEQLAYEALFDALGFSRNRAPFVRLAREVPVALLTALIGRRPEVDALNLAEAILLGVAGLLPSQRSNPGAARALDWQASAEADEREAIWALYRREWDGLGLGAADWVFGGVRPANAPPRRIATAARLVVRLRETGLVRGLLAPLRDGAATPADLERPVLVEDPGGFWATHADFGRPLPGGHAALLGRDRARDAVINVVLPLALAVAAAVDNRALADAAWQTYRAYPRATPYQATQRLAAEIGAANRAVATARRQQGLLYLLRNHCERAGCVTCPVAAGSRPRPRPR